MKMVIYLLGLGCIAYCTYVNLHTRKAFEALKEMFRSYQLRYLAAIPAVVAILFLISAPAAECPWPFWIVGILAAIEAGVAFVNPRNIYSRMLDWFFGNISERAFRILSIIGIVFGTLIMTLAN